ncbi:Na+/H+-dicarboxylate symporter [Roseovarius pacificus]|uniref:Na+/H+-dicarboxylate symporter n=2 Tax=Roseobacteraceae TaxID=2854170 RepID=A0A1M7KSY6_9RHOB|nr:dicarboxylate/amino acid:cation symporter [Roseovarius pacificus]SHM68572.1 Na+/H+-dicarboxylate symporter [Roseovarius pacificus]
MTQRTQDPPMQIAKQRFKLRGWITSRLWAQVMAGMILGFGLGLLLSEATGLVQPDTAEVIGIWLALPGKIFLALIAMVLIPLIFSSIVGGLSGAGSGEELRSVGLRLAAFILSTTTVAATIGVMLAQWLKPGEGLAGFSAGPADPALVDLNGAIPDVPDQEAPAALPDMIVNILPTNPTASIVQGDMLAVVVLALLVGISVTQVQDKRAAPFLALMDAVLSISMNIVKWAMFLAPFAVFGLMAQLVMRMGFETMLGISGYVGSVLLGLAALLSLYFLIALLFAQVTPVRLVKAAGSNLLLAFSTSSSSAVMPVTIQTARKLGVPENIANLVVPLGATMNMAGTALYQAVAILFLAQLAGVDLTAVQISVVVGTLVASSIGAPGTPGVSIAILVNVATNMGIPVEGMVIILGVDRLLDMCRTAVNVTGDLVAAVLLRAVGRNPVETA